MSTVWQKSKKGIVIHLRVTPRSSRNVITGVFVDEYDKASLKVATTAQPEKGLANKAVIQILTKTFKQAKSNFTVIAGETDRNKTVLIDGESCDVLAWLIPALEKVSK